MVGYPFIWIGGVRGNGLIGVYGGETEVKASFEILSSIHVYSIEPTSFKVCSSILRSRDTGVLM